MFDKDVPRRLLHIFDVPEVLPSGMPIAIFSQIEHQLAFGHTVFSLNYWPQTGSAQKLADFIARAPVRPEIVSSWHEIAGKVHRWGETLDEIYIHGLWNRSALTTLCLAAPLRAKVRHAPHGALDPAALQFGYLKKQLAWHVVQKWALVQAGCVVATSAREYDGIRRRLPRAKIDIVPLILPAIQPAPAPLGPRKRLLYFGRIHPIKGIEAILQAWHDIHLLLPDWDLALIGPQEEPWFSQFTKMANTLKLPRVSFHPEVMPDRRLEVLATANLVLAPSQTENFGLVIAEARALGRTVVASEQTGWRAEPGLVLFSGPSGLKDAILLEAQKAALLTAPTRDGA